jgi:threonine dehydratase
MRRSEKLLFEDIEKAEKIVSEHIITTPVVLSKALSETIGEEIYLKLENQQITGSFKVRGAINAISNLTPIQKNAGIVALSTGNHGRGLAYAARLMKIKCIICMSELVPKNKIDGIKELGAEVRLIGKNQDEAQLEADRLSVEEGMTYISPFDNLDVIAGQGTLGLEIHQQLPDLEFAFIPLSGGGLICGIAKALKRLTPNLKIIGVSMDKGAAMYESQKAGKPIFVKEEESLADALTGGIGLDNKYTFDLTKELVDDIILVSEKKIAEGVRHAYWHESQIVEGAGAIAIASLLNKEFKPTGRSVALMCGRNINIEKHFNLISS